MSHRVVVVTALAVVLLTGLVGAQGRSGGRGQGQADEKKEQAQKNLEETRVFKDDDLDVFRTYARRNNVVADALPPGIEKNLERGKPLPAGIARRALPPGLNALMPKVGRETSFSIVGDKLVALQGDKVVDILDGVFKK